MRYMIETISSRELEDEIVFEMAAFFRYMFSNAFGQYLLNPRSGEPISPDRVFPELAASGFVPLADLDAPPLVPDPDAPGELPRPVYWLAGERVVFWHHPEVTQRSFSRKLRTGSRVVLLRDCAANGKLAGFTFGRKCTFEENWQTEEWQHPYYYSGLRDPQRVREIDAFLTAMNAHRAKLQSPNHGQGGDFSPASEVYAWNCVVVHPEAQGEGNFWRLATSLVDAIPREDLETLFTLGETQLGAPSHGLFSRAGAIDIPGVLQKHGGEPEKGDLILVFARMSQYADYFSRIAARVG